MKLCKLPTEGNKEFHKDSVPASSMVKNPLLEEAPIAGSDTWCSRAKGITKRLQKKVKLFIVMSGETCVKYLIQQLRRKGRAGNVLS